jgi:hypothetical protein
MITFFQDLFKQACTNGLTLNNEKSQTRPFPANMHADMDHKTSSINFKAI